MAKVVNGDDLAVALLLRVYDMRLEKKDSEGQGSELLRVEDSPDLKEAASLAERLHFLHIHARLSMRIGNQTQLKISNEFAPSIAVTESSQLETIHSKPKDFSDAAAPITPKKRRKILDGILRVFQKQTTSPQADREIASAGQLIPNSSFAGDVGDGGFHPLTLSLGQSLGLESVSPRECKLPRLQLGELTVDEFASRFLHTNSPMLLSGTGLLGLGNVWSRSSLIEQFGHVNVSFGPIPYSGLFGQRQVPP